jgi:hypothetical protein
MGWASMTGPAYAGLSVSARPCAWILIGDVATPRILAERDVWPTKREGAN